MTWNELEWEPSSGYEVHLCDTCGEKKRCILIEDPYQLEVNNKSYVKWFCRPCYHNTSDEI